MSGAVSWSHSWGMQDDTTNRLVIFGVDDTMVETNTADGKRYLGPALLGAMIGSEKGR